MQMVLQKKILENSKIKHLQIFASANQMIANQMLLLFDHVQIKCQIYLICKYQIKCKSNANIK